MSRSVAGFLSVTLLLGLCGCHYAGVQRPVVALGILPSNTNEAELSVIIEQADKYTLPSDLLVLKLRGEEPYGHEYGQETNVQPIPEAEATAMRSLGSLKTDDGQPIISSVTLGGPLLIDRATLAGVRHAAARVRARLVFVYASVDDTEEGYNDASILYWTIIGMWTVPGTMVGYYSAAQGLLIDTVSGQVVAVVAGEHKYEEAVTAAARDIAKTRAQKTAREKSFGEMREDLVTQLKRLGAEVKGRRSETAADAR